jgi:hypothetical protein
MKKRMGFVSNSSSSSFLLTDTSGKLDETGLECFRDCVHEGTIIFDSILLGKIRFGWGPDELATVGPRIAFAYLQTQYAGNDLWLTMLEGVLKDWLSAKKIIWQIGIYPYQPDTGEGGKGFIDHQSSASEGQNTEIFSDFQTLTAFLFGEGSRIVLQNDNSYDYDVDPDGDNDQEEEQ